MSYQERMSGEGGSSAEGGADGESASGLEGRCLWGLEMPAVGLAHARCQASRRAATAPGANAPKAPPSAPPAASRITGTWHCTPLSRPRPASYFLCQLRPSVVFQIHHTGFLLPPDCHCHARKHPVKCSSQVSQPPSTSPEVASPGINRASIWLLVSLHPRHPTPPPLLVPGLPSYGAICHCLAQSQTLSQLPFWAPTWRPDPTPRHLLKSSLLVLVVRSTSAAVHSLRGRIRFSFCSLHIRDSLVPVCSRQSLPIYHAFATTCSGTSARSSSSGTLYLTDRNL